jgi:ATP-dependent Clp protease ATP-binding subunit ClpB
MDFNTLTQKSQEAVQQAQTKALRYGHVEVDGEHLLLALLEQADGLVPRLLARMEIPVAPLIQALEHELERRPRTSRDGNGSRQDLRDPTAATPHAPGRGGGETAQRRLRLR